MKGRDKGESHVWYKRDRENILHNIAINVKLPNKENIAINEVLEKMYIIFQQVLFCKEGFNSFVLMPF